MSVFAGSNGGAWPVGEGEMARLIRGFDWSATPLGPLPQWPVALRSAVGMMLDQGFPSYVWWGPDFIQLYNDAAIGMNRAKHPAMLGQPGAAAWREIWTTVGGFAGDVMAQGRAVLGQDLPLAVDRGSPAEPSWYAFSYNPLRDEAGLVAGIFVTAIETTARVLAEREHATAAARLRESEERYRMIFASTGEGIALCEAIFDQAGRATGYQVVEANPAYQRMDAGQGRDGHAARDLLDAAVRALATGETVRLDEVLAEPERWFETQIIPVQPDGQGRFIVVRSETTARRRAELVLRGSQERQEFLLALSDALRPLTDPAQIEATAACLLARHLGASRAAYAEVDGEELVIAGDHAEGLPSLAGRLPLDRFGKAEVASWRRGNTIVSSDTARAAELSEPERQAYAVMQVASFIAAPLQREGRLAAVLQVHMAIPRAWSSNEVALVEDVAERTWLALERVKAERAVEEREERLRIALEAGRMGTWRYDMRTGRQQWSRRQFEIFGLEPGPEAPTRALFLSLVHPDDLPLVEFNGDDLRPEGTFLDSEFRIIRPDGEQRILIAHALARFDENGRPFEIIGINQDVTEQRRAEQALRGSESLFRSFAEASSDVLWIRDAADMQWRYLSPAFEATYGLTRAEVEAADNLQSWASLVLPEDRQGALDAIMSSRAGEIASFEYRIRDRSGRGIRWLRSTTFPMRDAEGRVEQIGGIGHDLTELKAAEEHQRFLLAELQHRVRNTLAVIRAIVRRTAQSSATVEEYAGHLDGRIDAFARVQAAVMRNPIGGVDLAALIAEELRAYRGKDSESIATDGPPVRLTPKAAETVALAIHELATNAVKYGALSAPAGRLDLRWNLLPANAPPALAIEWRESGVGNVPRQPARRGFGTEVLLHMLAYELNASTTLDFLPDGVHCRIVLPVDGLVQEG